MSTHAALPSPVDDQVERILADCLAAADAEVPERIESACRTHPEHAVALRERLRVLVEIGFFGRGPEQAAAEVPERLAGFRLIRRIGSGGMGVVYLAHEEALDRTVALKLVRPEHLYFPDSRERFWREVKAIAGLRHPGIVPVYSVGEAQGIPFFAMEHVAGANLHQVVSALRDRRPERLTAQDLARVLAERADGASAVDSRNDAEAVLGRTWQEVCVRLVLQVAEALAHVHGHGILHRDVKPSNVMVTPEGRAMLLDFGLSASAGATRLTRSGAFAGSVPYMSPEQVRGRAALLDARTDVYSLGVTLYELLTLVCPHLGNDLEETRRRVLDGRVVPLRERNRAVSWDVETVCAKAMDPDPARRYATAADLAQDLRNVLEFRPIAARRPGALLRARRLAQRHPTLAVAALLGALIVLGGPVGWALLEQRSAHRIEEQRRTAWHNLEEALRAVYRMLVGVGNHELNNVPQADGVRRRLIEEGIGLCRRLRKEYPTEFRIQWALADALEKAGWIQNELGDRARAEESLAEAIRLYDGLPPEHRRSRNVLSARSMAALNLAGVGIALGRRGEAETWIRQCIADCQELTRRWPGDPVLACGLAEAWSNLAVVIRVRTDEAEEAVRAAIGILEGILAAHPDHDRARRSLAQALDTHAFVLQQARPAEAEASVRRALALAEELVAKSPDDEEYLEKLGNTRVKLGDLLSARGELVEAEAMQRAGLAVREQLLAKWPGRVSFLSKVGSALNNVGTLRMRARDDETACDLFRRALQIQLRALAASPGLISAREFLHVHRLNLARTLLNLDRPAEVLALDDAGGDDQAITVRDLLCRADFLCLCLEACPADGEPGGDARESLPDALGRRAVACLRKAAAAGLSDVERLRAGSLRPLRQRADYRQLLAEARASEPK